MKDKFKYINNPILLVIMITSLILNFALIYNAVILDKEMKEKEDKITELDKELDDIYKEQLESNPLLEDGQVINRNHSVELEEIDYDTFSNYLTNNSEVIVMLGYDGCIWCQRQEPILSMAMYEYKVDVKYLDISSITADERKKINGLHDDLASYGTPTFIKIKDNKVVMVSSGAKTISTLKNMFENMGMLGE